MRLQGKIALITGASRGIGLAIARAYVQEGAAVALCARDVAALAAAAETLRAYGDGARILARPCDVTRPEEVEALMAAVEAAFGRLDVLVNNAAVLGPRVPIAEYPLEVWREVLEVNLTGVFLVTRAALPLMRQAGGGSIINLSSGVGRRGRARWGAYAVSKGAVEIFTQVLAEELAPEGIRVNAVNPGPTRTRMRAQAYPEEDPLSLPAPEEIVPIFVYLASDESREITGQSLDARSFRWP
ncbi:SDR family NAD(P)-dependent oxidoreductase [Thermoflexus sp.]|uniref:SDR family NAD(P)-dependent oxidoreductase n=1 Tax=Thermoflexus sp. TaxID=1969742 RepID=UPI0025CF9022|nr:SDR family NAD(P)-dependent oxidoreductase [Thermoflexus sp.]MDW8180290.1 SDR family NAD(P)-dependent oxidoreductase [Anaerolineae bacterium]MCS6963066.1 SDR family NAD(P)-dependent oxidoreductase [Thermoflexus sp.]MCS7350839.1 SDR family NAD(P)-dependent oxidoreductase [Thermoflexus sp.]MCX7690229.1 SDR family NAD(P)-dependent oxidoreductase [Thermoflexus sp.]MDW8186026.1 SDR family NAD(P)-dependent oxidoreductase [Anaerolineae bacterium]